MAMTPKQAAEELLKIAEDMERDAAEVTMFVCEKCNHTASLATINTKRNENAKTAGENVVVDAITVNDKVQCLACEGVMAYKATEASEAYYFDPEKQATAQPETDEPEGDKPDTEPAQACKEAVNYDAL